MSVSHPLNRDLFSDVMVPNYAPPAVIPVRGEGSRVWDQDEREYVDLAGGIAVTALGHCHPELVEALCAQAKRLWHLSNVLTNEPALTLAQTLTEQTFAEKVFFANSGAEANEAAFKLARRYAWQHSGPERHELVACRNSFHGRTLFTVTVGGQEKYREGFEPVPGGVRHIDFNDVAALEEAITERTCAFVVEPVQGEGGVTPAHKAFLERARELCTERGALLVFDEVQCGVGRLGALYAYMHYGVTPDILTTAKALGGGFPVAAMLTTTAIGASLGVGTHGSTYGGNPLACAVAQKVMEVVTRPEVLQGVQAKSERLKDGLLALNRKYDLFQEIRGLGLLIGGELKPAYQGRAKDLMTLAMEAGVLILVAGPNVMRLAPSLVIPDADIDAGLAALDIACQRLTADKT